MTGAPPPLARATLDRAGHRRSDPHWLEAAWPVARLLRVDSSAGTALFRDVVTGDAADAAVGAVLSLVLAETSGSDRSSAVFLGIEPDGVAVFAVDGPLPAVAGARPASLRDVGHRLDDRDAGLVTTALAILNWHARSPYSPATGQPTTVGDAGWSRVDASGNQTWPRTDPAMIVLVHDGVAGPEGRCLLGNNATWPRQPGFRRFSCLAGYVEPGESAEAAVAREVEEEVGITLDRIDYVASQSWPFPGSLMLGYTAVADPSQPLKVDPAEITEARWFSRREIHELLAGGSVDLGTPGDPELTTLPMQVSIAHYLIRTWAGV
ncbi:NAD(+) diphosphatase [Asanoa iriomotensis]|uniref:NAD(+) diphosphatase n=1 Tax=Asanoa iriomotensis TaxID=234613 RepID=A0ABQ4CAJ8_9ACTN|nr:NAD(+) diphosphatase [Asanoa iriomotensis]GIF59787.1 putative NADH pyrophosphatase/NUDIX hydrolase [Asanoa iriomotensis]